jgi:hypothetical protein
VTLMTILTNQRPVFDNLAMNTYSRHRSPPEPFSSFLATPSALFWQPHQPGPANLNRMLLGSSGRQPDRAQTTGAFIEPPQNSRADYLLNPVQKGGPPSGAKLETSDKLVGPDNPSSTRLPGGLATIGLRRVRPVRRVREARAALEAHCADKLPDQGVPVFNRQISQFKVKLPIQQR